jgi:hypothetical protein
MEKNPIEIEIETKVRTKNLLLVSPHSFLSEFKFTSPFPTSITVSSQSLACQLTLTVMEYYAWDCSKAGQWGSPLTFSGT